MSISLGNEQGLYFTQQINSQMPILALKGLDFNFRVRNEQGVYFMRQKSSKSLNLA